MTALLDEVIENEIIPDLWEQGELEWTLDNTQQRLYTFLHGPGRKKVAECHRKLGKTKTALTFAISKSIKSKFIWNFFAQTKGTARKVVMPLVNWILETCPEEFKPVYRTIDSYYEFPHNGSRIYLIGCDDIKDIENQRGPYSDGNIFDEAGYNSYLDYLYKSVVAPQQLTSPHAINIFLSSTSEYEDHPFFKIAAEADALGSYINIPINENQDLTEEQKHAAFEESGGLGSPNCEREYFNKRITDPKRVIVPEFDASKHVRHIPRNDYYRFWLKYDSLDWGTVDPTAGLFGSVNFELGGVLYIEKEFLKEGQETRTDLLSDEIIKAHYALGWREPGEPMQRHQQIGDNDLRAMQDLNAIYGHSFGGVEKLGTLELMVNRLRMDMNEGKIIIDPACENLIRQLRNGMWKQGLRINEKREFARIPGFGHFDLIAALMYMNLMVDREYNPIPSDYGLNYFTHATGTLPERTGEDGYKNAFKY